MSALAAGRSSASRALPAVPLGRRLSPVWSGMIPERSEPPALRLTSSLGGGMARVRFVDLPHGLLEIVVAPPGLDQLFGGREGNGVVELQNPLDLALCRRRVVGACLAAQQEDRREESRRDADRPARHRQFLAAAPVEHAANDVLPKPG